MKRMEAMTAFRWISIASCLFVVVRVVVALQLDGFQVLLVVIALVFAGLLGAHLAMAYGEYRRHKPPERIVIPAGMSIPEAITELDRQLEDRERRVGFWRRHP